MNPLFSCKKKANMTT
ncbi:hypothetical protein F383_27542 [Gossypium arboreum]|uniref:Uncharacterized protein n=1 Tax=Gossypium arboreum TaxID=29729 RepID=A0A0B0MYG0_GOSAR|nr:hypothetical protein F383_27542 [Gossypium arboreum]